MKFDKDEIIGFEGAIYDDKLFETMESLYKYLDSCECTVTTHSFLAGWDDEEQYTNYEELCQIFNIDPQAEDAQEQVYELDREYTERLDELCEQCGIEYSFHRYEPQGPKYTLSGTFGGLKRFAKEYASHLDWSDPGQALWDIDKEADIDFNTGDEDLILAEFDNK